jgi:hypothetical protein
MGCEQVMITAIGITLLTMAAAMWLFADTKKSSTQKVIVAFGGCGVGMLVATSVILSLRYLP